VCRSPRRRFDCRSAGRRIRRAASAKAANGRRARELYLDSGDRSGRRRPARPVESRLAPGNDEASGQPVWGGRDRGPPGGQGGTIRILASPLARSQSWAGRVFRSVGSRADARRHADDE
jgi:hypothetical protein